MQKKLLLSIVSVAAVVVGAGVVATHGQDLTVAEESYSYSCASVSFVASGITESGEPGVSEYKSTSYGSNDTSAYTGGVTYRGFGDGATCTFSNNSTDCRISATKTKCVGLKVGGSSKFTIDLPANVYTRRAGLWVSGWSKEAATFKVNDSATKTTVSKTYNTSGGDNLVWALFDFDLSRTNSITIATTTAKRLIIGMVVFRIVE